MIMTNLGVEIPVELKYLTTTCKMARGEMLIRVTPFQSLVLFDSRDVKIIFCEILMVTTIGYM